jgi:hypothetical protein
MSTLNGTIVSQSFGWIPSDMIIAWDFGLWS